MNASQMSLEADRDLARQRVGICDAGQICEDTRISQALGDRCLAISSQSPERRGDRSWVHRRDVISSPSIRVASGVPGTKVAATEESARRRYINAAPLPRSEAHGVPPEVVGRHTRAAARQEDLTGPAKTSHDVGVARRLESQEVKRDNVVIGASGSVSNRAVRDRATLPRPDVGARRSQRAPPGERTRAADRRSGARRR